MQIKRKVVRVNGCETISYIYGGNEFTDLSALLANEFEFQGNFYNQALGVSWDDALAAGWHPADRDFSRSCDGWRKMLADGGRIVKTVVEDTVNVRDILFPDTEDCKDDEDEDDD